MNTIKDKVVYITGGTKGIGLGIAKKVLEKGGKVAFTSRSQKQADEIAAQLGNSERVLPLQSDVTDFSNEERALEQTAQHFGKVDVVIANAGVGHFASIENLTLEQWNQTININLTGVFHTTKASVPYLKQSKGYLITIASLAGTNFFANGTAYNASKFGLVGFTQAAMLDLRQHDIKTTVIMPGSVSTHFNGNTPDSNDNWKIQPEDIGQMVVDLLQMNARTLPSKIEVRPSFPHHKQ